MAKQDGRSRAAAFRCAMKGYFEETFDPRLPRVNRGAVHGNGRAMNTAREALVAALLASGCGGEATATADVPASLDAPDVAVVVTPVDVPVVSRDAGRVDRPLANRCDDGLRDCYPLGCRDILNDRQACGSCNHSCDDTERCAEGICVALPPGQAICDGETVVLSSDARHCGSCGRRCAESERCILGACGPLRCDAPLLLCVEGDPCFDSSSDSAHCGACGRACAADERCVGGECACASALTRCGDRCVDLQNDRANCGACGVRVCSEEACDRGHAVPQCGPGTSLCLSQNGKCPACTSARLCEGRCGGCCGSCGSGICRDGYCVRL